jgi:histidinol-phosphate aminotransferase
MGYRNLRFALDQRLYLPNLKPQGSKVSLHLNENAYAPPEDCLAITSSLPGLSLNSYERNGTLSLETRLAQIHGLSSDQILIDNGSSEVLKNLFLAMTQRGDMALFPSNGWAYNQKIAHLQGLTVAYYGLKCDEALRRYSFDIENMRRMISESRPTVILIASPNAFTGNIMASTELCDLLEYCRGETLVIVDQAYAEYSYNDDIRMSSILNAYDNVVFSRTLSKYYALANLRIGYAISNKAIIEYVKHFSAVFGTSGVCQAIACKALDDLDYYETIKERNRAVKNSFILKMNSLTKFVAYHSESNFVLVKLNGLDPRMVLERTQQEGMILGSCNGYGLEQHIRITVGDDETMDRLFQVLARLDA